MKTSKKLTGNGLYESSRMMLFEHRDAYLETKEAARARVKPEIDEQRLEEWSRTIAEAMAEGRALAFRVFDPFGMDEVRGAIRKADIRGRRLVIETEAGLRAIRVEDILDVE